MQISERRENGILILKPTGRLDAAYSDLLEKILLKNLEDILSPVIIDMSEVDYINSTGLRALLVYGKKLLDKEKTLVLLNIQPNPKSVIELSGLLSQFPLFDILEDALVYCKQYI